MSTSTSPTQAVLLAGRFDHPGDGAVAEITRAGQSLKANLTANALLASKVGTVITIP